MVHLCRITAATGQRRFSAFISYSRHDSRDARWLQSALESFRMPAHLAGRSGAHGPVPAALRPVFLDRSDLSASADLRRVLADAINDSEWLVLLCTPWAASSQWVNREIAMMAEAGRGQHILPALFEGDESNAFPPALRALGGTPLAADFRAEGDGRRLALLKLVAAMTGVALDELVDRERCRRVRRLCLASFGALAISASLAGTGLWAVAQQRDARAESSRSLATVDTLLTDLRAAIKPVGNLETLHAINLAAAHHLQGPGASKGSDAALVQRARLLSAMGEDDYARGRLDAAERLFTQAFELTHGLLEKDPESPDRLLAHAHNHFWLGELAWSRSDAARARTEWNAYRALSLKLRAREPDAAEWQLELAYAESNLGLLDLRHAHDLQRAEQRFTAALAAYELAYQGRETEADAVLDRSDGLAWLADTLRLSGQIDAAEQRRIQQKALLEQGLVRHPGNYPMRRQLLANSIAMGRIAEARHLPGLAIARYAAAEQEARRLLQQDPSNALVGETGQMAALFAARLSLGTAAATRMPALSCEKAGQSHEVRDWCLMVLARQLAHRGQSAAAERLTADVEQRQRQPGAPRLSATFGLDFHAEIAAVRQSMAQGRAS